MEKKIYVNIDDTNVGELFFEKIKINMDLII